MDETNGVNEEIRTDEKSNNIFKYIEEKKLPIPMRQVYRKFHLKKADVERAVAGFYKYDGKVILSKIVTGTRRQ